MKHWLKRFVEREHGSVGIIFALSAIPLFVLAGGVIDYSYAQDERMRLQNALDSAVLAAMRSDVETEEELRTVIQDYLQANYRPGPRVQFDPANIEVMYDDSDGATRLTATVKISVSMPFWSLVGVNTYNMTLLAEATEGITGLEVALVLDNTGSMSWYVNGVKKIDELKAGAKSLVQQLHDLTNNNSQISGVKVGLVPYTNYVRLDPTAYRNAPWLSFEHCPEQECTWHGFVGYREYPYDITDEGYDTQPVIAIPSKWYYNTWIPDIDKKQRQQATVHPLVDISIPDNKDTFDKAINDMNAWGWTYIPSGLMWGWRMLSAHAPLTEAVDSDTAADENIKKYIILMTDGVNTCQRKDGDPLIQCKDAWKHGSPDAPDRMLELCDNIKAEGIEIISIAYDISDDDQEIEDLMRECSSAGYYAPRPGQLVEVFNDIANRIARLHLSR